MLNLIIQDQQVRKALNKIIDDSKTKNLPWSDIGRVVEESIDRSIDLGGRYEDKDSPVGGNNKWRKPKPPATNPPLYRSGQFRSSIMSEVESDGVLVGSPLEYPEYLQFGTRKMEERPWANITPEEDYEKIENVLRRHLGV